MLQVQIVQLPGDFSKKRNFHFLFKSHFFYIFHMDEQFTAICLINLRVRVNPRGHSARLKGSWCWLGEQQEICKYEQLSNNSHSAGVTGRLFLFHVSCSSFANFCCAVCKLHTATESGVGRVGWLGMGRKK